MSADRYATLSPQERRAICCRCVGEMTWDKTAVCLGISRATLEEYLASAYRKLGVKTIRGACVRVGMRAQKEWDGRKEARA